MGPLQNQILEIGELVCVADNTDMCLGYVSRLSFLSHVCTAVKGGAWGHEPPHGVPPQEPMPGNMGPYGRYNYPPPPGAPPPPGQYPPPYMVHRHPPPGKSGDISMPTVLIMSFCRYASLSWWSPDAQSPSSRGARICPLCPPPWELWAPLPLLCRPLQDAVSLVNV